MTERQVKKFLWGRNDLQARKRPNQASEFIKRLRRLQEEPNKDKSSAGAL